MYNHFTVSKQMTDVKLFVLHSNTWNHLTNDWYWIELHVLDRIISVR